MELVEKIANYTIKLNEEELKTIVCIYGSSVYGEYRQEYKEMFNEDFLDSTDYQLLYDQLLKLVSVN